MSQEKENWQNDIFEATMKGYLRQGKNRLENELSGTREAINLIAKEKMRDFIAAMDKGLDKDERDFLIELIVHSMQQSFCYGYSIGKIEGTSGEKVYL